MKEKKENIKYLNPKGQHEIDTTINECSVHLRFTEKSPEKVEHEVRRSLMDCYARRVEKWQ